MNERQIQFFQYLFVLSFTLFDLAVLSWIGRLIYIALQLKDTVNGSLGIAIVAGSLFLVLLGVFHYLFWGLKRAKEQV